jgi:hypothetical protein
MSYFSGILETFENRLHQLPANTGDLQNFAIEGSGYLNTYTTLTSGTPPNKILTPQLLQKWDREMQRWNYVLTQQGAALQQSFFFNIANNNLLDVAGQIIYDVNNQPITTN